MDFLLTLSLLVPLFMPILALNGTQSALEARQNGCQRGVHIIALGGKGTTEGDLGYLAPLAYSIRDSIPRSDLSQIGYPAGAEGPEAIAYAVPNLRAHITEYSAGCPNTKIVLASYSVGATAVMNVLCGAWADGSNELPNRYRKNILANVAYGDLSFLPGKSYDVGSCTQPGRLRRTRPGKCFPFGRKTASYCDAGDVNCCSGTDPNVHFTYPQKYDQAALGFVLARWNRYKANN